MTIAVIALVAVVMGMSLVTPALANHPATPDHKGVLVFAPGQCGTVPDGKTCVAVDRDADLICDSPAFIIPTKVAERLGIAIYDNCNPPHTS